MDCWKHYKLFITLYNDCILDVQAKTTSSYHFYLFLLILYILTNYINIYN